MAVRLIAPRFAIFYQEMQWESRTHRHEGYDHGYYFIQSFIADHLAHHAAILRD